ncbi:hypothetical protein [Phenylobacterium sp. SCN 70-31]|uniref:hypothetical protein n=1 Tax=Phenylobacterium sp. SCN 70-31 TaxID=1660129 RepID=UPI00086F281B|nr:hypothetical protein [Phenylobacterium sp. SCN 70-31]ODT87227.1 MAG: hypothetical protein ABS78_12475 [Phenylobacterium sp. SCN 70-31]
MEVRVEIVSVSAATGADYSALDTREKAWRAVERGDLVAILMLPAMFGGTERDENIIFVPEAVAERKDRIDDEIVVPMVRSGKTIEYSVTPRNDRQSMVPIALDISISPALNVDPSFYRIEIWAGSGE